MKGHREAIGLPAVIAVLMVSAVAAAGAVAVALQQRLDAHDAGRRVRVSAAAESAIRIALANWNADTMRSITAGATVSLPVAAPPAGSRVSRAATAERVGRSRYIIRGQAEIRTAGRATARASALATVVMVQPEEVWSDFYAALATAGDVSLGGSASVTGIDAGVPTHWSVSDCPAGYIASITSLLGSPDRPGIVMPAGPALATTAGSSVAGLPPVWLGAPLTDTAGFSRLGPLSLRDVAAIADRIESGTVRLAPVAAGGLCDTISAGNWGDPLNPTGACFGWLPLIFSPADLELAGGTGQGVLVVDGDVTLRTGVEFSGAILATGRIDIDGAHVTGAIRAGAGVRVDGTVTHNACVLSRTFALARAFRKPFRMRERLWLPSF